jgi:hypothetical protein
MRDDSADEPNGDGLVLPIDPPLRPLPAQFRERAKSEAYQNLPFKNNHLPGFLRTKLSKRENQAYGRAFAANKAARKAIRPSKSERKLQNKQKKLANQQGQQSMQVRPLNDFDNVLFTNLDLLTGPIKQNA